jgi:hypothetical protein
MAKNASRRSLIKPAGRDYTSEAETRVCLRCRRDFESEHRGHRICTSCKGSQVFGSPVAEHYSTGYRTGTGINE